MDANEVLLLGLLGQEEMHGYKLHEFLEHELNFVSDLKRPTAYRLLEQLLHRQLVERATEREGRRPERMVYRLTAAGQARFETLLREQLADAERVIHAGNVALLFSDRLPPDERRRLLARRRDGVAAQREVLLSIVEAHAPGSTVRLALQHDLAHLDVELGWLTRTIEGLKGECSTSGVITLVAHDPPRRTSSPGAGSAIASGGSKANAVHFSRV
ncbi:MAG TPA: helix-turn-helix transcriptional regulator [Chloroflexota bacterium]|nr:helix-turn-helix transcriptional regulator [Chloroflexota bacterium]